jgi:hypothetical protein
VIALAAIAIASSIPDDDDETLRDDLTALMIRRATDDLLTFYTLVTVDDFLWTPVSLSWLNNVMGRSFSAVMNREPDDLLRITPIANQLDKLYEFTADSEFNLTEK